nr:hypothetical protein [Tanacetum cinerariifolium]
MAPKRTTRSSPATTTTTTTPATNAQLKALIDQGIADALAARDADRSQNGKDNHDSGTGVRRQAPPARECTYQDFMKCKPLYFKGTERVTVVSDVAYAMTWTNQKKKMTDNYCPRGEIKNLKKLALMYARMFPEESDKIERYIGGFLDMIHKSVMASKPKSMHDANTGRAYTAGEKKPYGRSKPLCSKCNYHHDGSCAPKCHKCNRVSHLARDCESSAATNNQRNLTCYECGNQGHYKSDCPELKNQNHGDQAEGTGACGMVHALRGGETNQDLNNMEDHNNA